MRPRYSSPPKPRHRAPSVSCRYLIPVRGAIAEGWDAGVFSQCVSEVAYACFTLFLRSADRRTYVWMAADMPADRDDSFGRLKRIHVELNLDRIKDAMKEREKKLDSQFLSREIFPGIGPWS